MSGKWAKLSLSKSQLITMCSALYYATEWNDDLVDAHAHCKEHYIREIDAWEKQTKQFKSLLEKLKGVIKEIEGG